MTFSTLSCTDNKSGTSYARLTRQGKGNCKDLDCGGSGTETEDDADERFDELADAIDSIIDELNDEMGIACISPNVRYQRFLSAVVDVIVEYEDVYTRLTEEIQAESEPESEPEIPDGNPARPPVQPYVAETKSRPSNKPMALPKLKQRAMQWT